MKRLNLDEKPGEGTPAPAPPATWTPTERDPDTGLMKEPEKTDPPKAGEEVSNVAPE